MTLVPIPYRAGVVKDDPEYTAKGYAVDSEWVRAVNGYFQSQGGWEKRLTQQFDGITRGTHEWTTSTNTKYASFGTNTKLYLMMSGWIANITPSRASGTFANDPVATTINSAVVTITHVAHGALNGATVYVGNATATGGITLAPFGSMPANAMSVALGSNVVTVNWTAHGFSTGWELVITGGVVIGGIAPAGTYLIRKIDANYFQFYSATTATSTVTGGGGTPTYVARRPYTITYKTVDTYTITYDTVAAATATGGGAAVQYLYEINPGRLYGSAGQGWSSGGYSTGGYGASIATGVSPNDAAVWALDNYGNDLLASRIGTTIYRWQGNWSMRAQALTNAPAQVEWFCVTPNRTVMAFGCTNEDGAYDPLMIRFTDSIDPTVWDVDLTVNAGSIRIGQGSRLIGGGVALNTIFCWTDTSFYQINFVGAYEQMYIDQILGQGFGLIGPLAWETVGDQIMWVMSEKSFAYFSGGAPKQLPCKSQTWFGEQLSDGQNFKIFAFHDSQYNAMSFGYATDPTQEVTGYIRLDIDQQTPDGAGGWSVGSISRTGWIDAHSFSNPIGFGTDGYIYNQETGNGADGAALTRYVEWAPIDVQGGNRVINVNKIVYDVKITSGTMQVYLYFRRWPQDTLKTKGPYSITGSTRYNRLRGQGRQVGMKVLSSTTNDEWRLGVMRADMDEGARR